MLSRLDCSLYVEQASFLIEILSILLLSIFYLINDTLWLFVRIVLCCWIWLCRCRWLRLWWVRRAWSLWGCTRISIFWQSTLRISESAMSTRTEVVNSFLACCCWSEWPWHSGIRWEGTTSFWHIWSSGQINCSWWESSYFIAGKSRLWQISQLNVIKWLWGGKNHWLCLERSHGSGVW